MTLNLGQLMAATLVALAMQTGSIASASLSDDVVGTLYTMKTIYSAEYAPTGWKKKYAGYDLNTEFDKAIAAAQSNPNLTQKDARHIFKNFIYAMKDYHTSISFMATESASLPLTIRGAGDHYFIVAIDRSKLSEAAFPFHIGDEVVSIDGQAMTDAVAALQSQIPLNVEGTDRALAEARFFARASARGIEVPTGAVNIGILSKGQTTPRYAQLMWDYKPEMIAPRSGSGLNVLLGLQSAQGSLLRPMMSADVNDRNLGDAPVGNPFDIGARQSFTPDLGKKIWESSPDSNFYAYIFQRADHKLIGYVRIPSYVTPDYVKATAEFAQIIDRMQSITDSMVIDQVNNPGGSVFYLYTLASMLSDQPLKTPRHRMAVTPSDVNDALKEIEKFKDVKTDEEARKLMTSAETEGYPVSYEFVRFHLAYARFIVSEWNAGRKLTNPYWISGVDQINPGAVHYTKPILLLINHLDFSGGDFFPTIMQDNKRVTIMGSRTAGAGGYVNDVVIPNNVGIAAFRVTESIAERVDGNPIENLGVTPDISYEMTAEDFTTGFAPYVKAINTALDKITP